MSGLGDVDDNGSKSAKTQVEKSEVGILISQVSQVARGGMKHGEKRVVRLL